MNPVYDIDQAGNVLCTYHKGPVDGDLKAVSESQSGLDDVS